MNADGSGLRTLARTSGGAGPIWISDLTIAFTRTCMKNACAPSIVVMSANGGPEQLLISNAYGLVRRP